MTAIADTSFIVATASKTDRYRAVCLSIYQRELGEILLPQSTLAEVAYMLGRGGGNSVVSSFLLSLPQTKYRLIPLNDSDILRTAQLLEQYADSRVDFVDASLVAVAERLNITRILTLDQRDFHIVRPRHHDHLELLPQPD